MAQSEGKTWLICITEILKGPSLKEYDLRETLLASLHPPTYLLLGEEGLFGLVTLQGKIKPGYSWLSPIWVSAGLTGQYS